MEKVIIVLGKSRFWLVVFFAFLIWFFILLSLSNPEPTAAGKASTAVGNTVRSNFVIFPDDEVIAVIKQNDTKIPENDDPCAGRYIYIHEIPSKFNADLLDGCRSLSNWTDMCELRSNHGFGPRLVSSFGDRRGWFSTNQFSLEVIFHSRMQSSYHCLTNHSSSASAIFVPYYAGLDVARHLWGGNGDGGVGARDSDSLELAKWLRWQPEWQRLSGRDHFLVAGRVTWDFRRLSDDRENDWGNRLLLLPETRNMTVLTIESSPWHDNDFAVPYPTYFHPSSSREVRVWQERMRSQKRRILFSFAGAPRPEIRGSIRNEIIKQCKRSSSKRKRRSCMILGPNKCRDPISVMKMFQSSVFCLQPRGDSSTRKSAFDAIVAGCVPVFFHPGSAYVQYLWHLPRDYAKYSVFIPEAGVKNGTVSLERVLAAVGRKRVAAMREEVVRLIPKVVYGSSRLGGGVEDAFDVAVSKVLERVDKIRSGVSLGSFGREELSWKYNFFGSVDQGNEWDHYFSTS